MSLDRFHHTVSFSIALPVFVCVAYGIGALQSREIGNSFTRRHADLSKEHGTDDNRKDVYRPVDKLVEFDHLLRSLSFSAAQLLRDIFAHCCSAELHRNL